MSKTRVLADLTSTSGNATVASISNVGDVLVATLGDNQFLVWDATSSKWKNTGMKGKHFPGQTNTSDLADRRAIKRAADMPVALSDYAVAGTGDWSSALQTALDETGGATGTNYDHRLFIPTSQNYLLFSPVTMKGPTEMFGAHMSQSVLTAKHYSTAITCTGQYGTGGRISDLSVAFDLGAGNGAVAHIYALAYQNSSSPATYYSPDFMEFRNLNLTTFNSTQVQYNLILDGNGRTNDVSGTVPIGLRNCVVDRIEAFNATFRSLDIRHCRSLRIGAYAAYAGTVGVGGAAIDSVAGHTSQAVLMIGCNINGQVSVSNSYDTKIVALAGATVSLGTNNTNFVQV